ncbi:sugar transferase [uncultured Holdemanella sp.]|uniref:sugar transferase n=1 Tax=uncultured Holdemanella sp. TaxID=1763549 RepID=UPI00258819A5|nr:sugar transferase [uncultured Holdemanella sp.]
MLKNWNELPEYMRTDEVRPYYDLLQRKKLSLFFKRVFDIVVSLIMIILCSSILLIISILIVKDSKGGVFYRQERVTQYGRVFRIFKFRTMVQNADQIGTQVTVSNDSRITKIGSKLRNCRLDELPQLFNIFLGDMTFVGTRPESVHYVKSYTKEMYATLLLPAGVTSEASIQYKDEADLLDQADDVDNVYINEVLPEKMKYNLNSIKEFSFFKEIATMFRTVFAVLR